MNGNAAVTVLAVLAAMARCLGENMAKVKLTAIPVSVNPGVTPPAPSADS